MFSFLSLVNLAALLYLRLLPLNERIRPKGLPRTSHSLPRYTLPPHGIAFFQPFPTSSSGVKESESPGKSPRKQPRFFLNPFPYPCLITHLPLSLSTPFPARNPLNYACFRRSSHGESLSKENKKIIETYRKRRWEKPRKLSGAPVPE